MAALLVVGILATDIATFSSLRSFLYGRLDEQIDVAQDQAYGYIVSTYIHDLAAGSNLAARDPSAWLAGLADTVSGTPAGVGLGVLGDGSPSSLGTGAATSPARGRARATRHAPALEAGILAARISPDVYLEVLDSSGRVVMRRPSGSRDEEDPPPVLPEHLVVQRYPARHRFGASHGVYAPDRPVFEVRAAGTSGTRYEAEAVAVPGGTVVTLVARTPTDETLSSLVHVEILVSSLVLLALIAITWYMAKLSLRPLEEMTATAGEIAAGDLARRVAERGDRSEVGRLAKALNAMLSQIEQAFAVRSSSESRLRRFVADASHELRTPLTSIRGYAELLRKGAFEDEPARLRAAERIEQEAARMGVLVDDLLLLARLDQGRPLEMRPLDLSSLVDKVVEDARVVDEQHPIDFVSPGRTLVTGDSHRLHQAVANLVRNAQVHTPPGTPVHVEIHQADGTVHLKVEDEGPGLTPEQAEKVFDPFYRASSARTGAGTGLGLAIVAAVLEAHGGSARVYPGAGGGTSFEISLPAMPVPTPQAGDLGGPR